MPAQSKFLAGLFALAVIGSAPAAHAQSAIDQTGTGGGPTSTITAPHTTSVGVTKPPGGAGTVDASRSGDMIAERDRREKIKNDRISNSICRGC